LKQQSYPVKIPEVKKDTEIYALKNLGSGEDGFVWQACTKDGVTFVIKFSKYEKAQETLAKEANLWKHIWNIQTSVRKLGGEYALLMPFVRMISKNDAISNKLLMQKVRNAVDEVAKKGYFHKDLCDHNNNWKHAGLLGTNGKERVVFIDLADVDKEQDQEASKKKMLSILQIEE